MVLLLALAIFALVVLIIVLFVLALYLVSIFPYRGGLTPPFVPSSRKLLGIISKTLDPQPSSLVYELGAGDMRVSLAAWKREPAAIYIGIDKHLYPRTLAQLNIWRKDAGKNVSIHEADFYTIDLSVATHIYSYLFPEAMDKLLPKFQKELRPGAIVVSLDFEFKHKEPERTIDLKPYNLRLGKKLFVYRF